MSVSHSWRNLDQKRDKAFFLTADEEFDELCFEFGIELDEVVSRER